MSHKVAAYWLDESGGVKTNETPRDVFTWTTEARAKQPERCPGDIKKYLWTAFSMKGTKPFTTEDSFNTAMPEDPPPAEVLTYSLVRSHASERSLRV